ncbi:MAG TPA: glycosyl hydrolase [Acidimicrobiia bacterium]|nr:glycosyl hydrolase [Acidimicrobiia bacterium]
MRRTLRRHRLVLAAISACLVGAVLAGNAQAVDPSRDAKDDPHAYKVPHAGLVAPPRAPGPLAPATGSLIGTHSGDSATGPLDASAQKILVTEEGAGRRMDIDNSYYGAFSSIADKWDPTKPGKTGLTKLAFWDIEMGRIPLVGWGCGSSKAINSGSQDTVIRKTAEAMKAFGNEFFMRYCWEMDGDKRHGEVGSPAEFVSAWIRMHKIFDEVGADNVIWVWCGNANTFKNPNQFTHAYAWEYYPGDEWVDWVSADGYNWAASDRNQAAGYKRDRWRGFVEIYDEFMTWARSTGPVPQSMQDDAGDVPAVFPRKTVAKPIMIGEYGAITPEGAIKDHYLAVSAHNTKEAWLREAHDSVNGSKPRTDECPWCGIYSDIAAVVYFDVVGPNGPWLINSSPESIAAYREAAQDPWFNQIHTIGWGPAANRPDKPVATPDPAPAPAPEPSQGHEPNLIVTPPPARTPGSKGSGYWMLGADGKTYAFGDAKSHGDATAAVAGRLPAGVTAADVEPSPTGNGYWVVDSAGTVSNFGDAKDLGDVDAGRLATGETVTSLSSTPTGNGYWVFTTKGRAVTFGDAVFYGDMSRANLNGPVLDSVPSPSGRGYWMVASDGGIFAFGDATFAGSMGAKKLNAPVQSLVPDTTDGRGYWLVASDGGVFAFDAPFRGSMGGARLNKPISGMVPFGNGYLMVAEDGGVFNFSEKAFSGSLGGTPPSRPIVAVAALD